MHFPKLSFIYIYSKRLNRRLQNIVDGMHRIGFGDFSHKFLPEEEFGQTEGAVDHMSVQIDDLIQENYKKQLVIKSTELNLLQEQIILTVDSSGRIFRIYINSITQK